MESIYNTLRSLPLFRGLSKEKLEEVVANTRLHFLKYLEGEPIVRVNDRCTHIKFIIKGSARITVSGGNDRFRVSHTVTGPDVIMPDYLFGRVTQYPCEVVAQTPVGILQIEKGDWVKMMMSDEVFLFNFLNIVSMNAQKSIDGVLALSTGSLEERIAFWILALTQARSTDIVLQARQRELYSLFNVQRMSLNATLESMRKRGLIEFTPDQIKVVSRRDLVDLLMKHDED